MSWRVRIVVFVVIALAAPASVGASDADAREAGATTQSGWRLGFYVDTGDGPKLIGHGTTVGTKAGPVTDGLLGGDAPLARVVTNAGQAAVGIAAEEALPTWVDLGDRGPVPPGATLVEPPSRGPKKPVRFQKLAGRRLEVRVRPGLGVVSPEGVALRRIELWRDRGGGTVRRVVDVITLKDADGGTVRVLLVADRARVVAPTPPPLGGMVPGPAAVRPAPVGSAGGQPSAAARAPARSAGGGRFSRPAVKMGPPGCHSEWTKTGSRLVCDDGTMIEEADYRPLVVTPPPAPTDPDAQRRERVLIPRLVVSTGFCAGMIVAAAGMLAFSPGLAVIVAGGPVTIGLALVVMAFYAIACGLLAHDANALMHGEPHLMSLDGHHFDLQAIGEFVFLDSPTLEVQGRYTGVKGQATSAQATAVRSGEHVIESYFSDSGDVRGGLPVIVDGAPTRLKTKGLTLSDGTFVAPRSSPARTVLVVSPAGSYVLIENLSVSQNVVIGLAPSDANAITGGLAGIPDGNEANDFVLRDTSTLDAAAAETIEGLYGTFAAVWRVRPDERLFTVGNASDFLTEEYTSLPEALGSLASFSADKIREARATCRRAGVTADGAIDGCAYDILVTGDSKWARQAAASGTARDLAAVAEQATGAPSKPTGLAQGENVDAPTVAVDRRGVVHVAWTEGLTTNSHVVVRSRPSNGAWSEPEVLSTGTTGVGTPALKRDPKGRVCLFWSAIQPSGVYLRCYQSGHWSRRRKLDDGYLGYAPGFIPDRTPIVLTQGASCCLTLGDVELSAPGTAGGPALAVDSDGRIHAAWWQAGAPEGQPTGMVHRISEDGGATFSDVEAFDDSSTLSHELVADRQGRVHWLSQNGTYRRWSADDGWSDAVQADGDAGRSGGRLAVDPDGRAVAVFPTSDGVVLAQQRSDGTFSNPRRVAGRDTVVGAVALAVDVHDNRHLVWVTSDAQPRVVYQRL